MNRALETIICGGKRGIFERQKGSGIWWIRWTDHEGRKRREKVGTFSAAQKLLAKRHTQKLESIKLPDHLRSKAVTFRELCDDALVHSQAENSEKQTHELRLRIIQLLAEFGSTSVASIKKSEILGWLAEQSETRDWSASSRNRWQATFSLIFRVGIDNEKIDRNPAARIRRKTEAEGASASCPTPKRSAFALRSSSDSRNSCLTSFCPSIPGCG